MWVCVLVCVSRKQWKKGKKRQRYQIPGMEGRPDLQVLQLFGWKLECMCIVHVWGHKCRPKGCSEGNICLSFNQTAAGRMLEGKACCLLFHTWLCPSSTRLLRFKKVQSQMLTVAVALECVYIPVMLWFFCTPAGLYKAVVINHKNVSNLLKSFPVTIFRRPLLPCKMIWFRSFVTCAFILWRKNWIIVIKGLNIIRYINVFLGSTMWPSYTLAHYAHSEKCHVRFWVMSKKYSVTDFLKTVRCSQAGRITGCFGNGFREYRGEPFLR